MGPTASGKTDIAVELVRRLPLEIISVDSAMIYRGMDIGTAKPASEILKIAPHRLIDIRDPSESYSCAEFCKDAKREIKSILNKQRIPLLVGGTMFYFHSLQRGLSILPSADQAIREKLKERIEKEGIQSLYTCLKKYDPLSAQRLHPNDTQRIQRALEIYELTGQPFSAWQTHLEAYAEPSWNWVNIVLWPVDRALLHRRIQLRFHAMIEKGWIEEVKRLYDRPDLNLETPALRTVGYRQLLQYLAGYYDCSTAIEKGIAATRQLAKRQLTWLRSWSVNYKATVETLQGCDDILKFLEKTL